jgi:hypothetical protein
MQLARYQKANLIVSTSPFDLLWKMVFCLPLLFQNVFKSLHPKIFLARNVIKYIPLPLTNLRKIFR